MTDLFNHDFDAAFEEYHNDHNFDDGFYAHDYGHEYGHFTAADNIYGGHDIIEDGVHMGHTEANIFGGRDIYDHDNQFVGRTMDNGIGGENIFSNDGFEGTLDHVIDGQHTFHDMDGDFSHFDVTEAGNASHIMSYDDPLSHMNSYILPDLIL